MKNMSKVFYKLCICITLFLILLIGCPEPIPTGLKTYDDFSGADTPSDPGGFGGTSGNEYIYKGISFSGECVSSVRKFYKTIYNIDIPFLGAYGGAYLLWNDIKPSSSEMTRIQREGNVPQPDDLIVWNKFPPKSNYGHVAVAVSVSGKDLIVVDSNYFTTNEHPAYSGCMHTVNLDDSRIFGWYHPLSQNSAITPGTITSYTADGVSWNMAYVPAVSSFPTGLDDSTIGTVNQAFQIGETEITYLLWATVYIWAIDSARGVNKYNFDNAGTMGDGFADQIEDTFQHPVTKISWRDTIVWCNAATEWYNSKNASNYSIVYSHMNSILRDTLNVIGSTIDGVYSNPTATGFRLLNSMEWELAARWRNDAINTVNGYSNPWYTQGDSASGATADYNDAIATGVVAVYWDDCNPPSTAPVKSKGFNGRNALGLYDMSGNVWEWTFDFIPSSFRIARSGSFFAPTISMQLGNVVNYIPDSNGTFILGFRIARTDISYIE